MNALSELKRRGQSLALLALGVLALLLLFWNLSGYGIWDPWELNAADAARRLMDGEAGELTRPPLPTRVLAWGFSAFGVREWGGRAPMALAGLGTLAAAWWLGSRLRNCWVGIAAAAVVLSTPLFLFNARQMSGDAFGFLFQALLGICLFAAVFDGGADADADADAGTGRSRRPIWLVGAVVAGWAASAAAGAMLGVLPPLAAVALVWVIDGGALRIRQDPRGELAGAIVLLATVGVGAGVVVAVATGYAEYSGWVGAVPVAVDPPTYEEAIERLFHAFVPWSAVLPLGVACLLYPPSGGGDSPARSGSLRARFALVLWMVFGFAAQTLFLSRYGEATFLPVVPAGVAVAFCLADTVEERRPWRVASILVLMLCLLAVRDYRLYPGSPTEALAVPGLEVPDAFNPKRMWQALLGVFALVGYFVFAVAEGPSARPSFRAPYQFLKTMWQRGRVQQVSLVLGGMLLLVCTLGGAVAWVVPEVPWLSTLARKVMRALIAVGPALALMVAGYQLAWYAFQRLGRLRVGVLVAAGLLVGTYAGQGYLHALSAHLSPREVYDTYNALAVKGEVLGEYRVGGRAAAYYAQGEVQELANQGELLTFLEAPERRWLALSAKELAVVDREYRKKAGRHLFVADARSAVVILAANQPVEGREDQNPLAKVILAEPPPMERKLNALFEDKIEFLGYNLDLPHDGYVGAGETFTAHWVFRVKKRVPGSYKIFVHIDGQGLRLNGDHEPVNELYPVRMWEPGDIVVDSQEFTVPANYRAGTYTIYLGFFSGSTRIKVKSEHNDGANRVNAGRMFIR